MRRTAVPFYELAASRGFTERQTEHLEEYVRARVKAREHDHMAFKCDDMDDYEGQEHHNRMSREADRDVANARRRLVKAGVKFGGQKQKGVWTFYSKKGRPLRIAERDIELTD